MSIIKNLAKSYLYDICLEVEEKFTGESGKGAEKLALALTYVTSKLPWYIKIFLSETTIKTLIEKIVVPAINKVTDKIKDKVTA